MVYLDMPYNDIITPDRAKIIPNVEKIDSYTKHPESRSSNAVAAIEAMSTSPVVASTVALAVASSFPEPSKAFASLNHACSRVPKPWSSDCSGGCITSFTSFHASEKSSSPRPFCSASNIAFVDGETGPSVDGIWNSGGQAPMSGNIIISEASEKSMFSGKVGQLVPMPPS